MVRSAWLFLLCVFLAAPRAAAAADQWSELKTPHFTVISNASDGNTRSLAWQLEQVRSTMVNLWAWAQVDLNKPLTVIAVKDENSMRALAPEFWEKRGGMRPASVWVTGSDRHYLAIRTGLDVESQGNINPYITSYFSYINLVMMQSLSPDLPLWLSRGLSGVLSNTLVKNDHIIIGAPIPWHLQALRERPRALLPRLLTTTQQSPALTRDEGLETFDAQSWAFVHFLMFGDTGARADKLNQFARAVSAGKDASTAFRDTLGTPESLEAPFRMYFEKQVGQVRRANIDVAVERERIPVRRLSAAESAAARALFHVATQRPVEARAAITEARAQDPKAPGSYEAEGLLLDREDKDEAAKVALEKAVEAGSTNGYVHYRLAGLTWRRDADQDTLKAIEGHLTKATTLNTRDADAYSWLGEIRAALGAGEPAAGLVLRAVTLEPLEAVHRLRAASVLARLRKYDEAAAQAEAAQRLATTDGERQRARELLERIAKARAGGGE
jgi:tetratricopeptide (TPR) repeat protein